MTGNWRKCSFAIPTIQGELPDPSQRNRKNRNKSGTSFLMLHCSLRDSPIVSHSKIKDDDKDTFSVCLVLWIFAVRRWWRVGDRMCFVWCWCMEWWQLVMVWNGYFIYSITIQFFFRFVMQMTDPAWDLYWYLFMVSIRISGVWVHRDMEKMKKRLVGSLH